MDKILQSFDQGVSNQRRAGTDAHQACEERLWRLSLDQQDTPPTL